MIKLLDILNENLKPKVGDIITVTNINPQDFPGGMLPKGYEDLKVGDKLKIVNTWRNAADILFGTDKTPRYGLNTDDIEIFTSKSMAEKLDLVGQEDEDIDNDGDTDKTDKYLLNRRKAIAANIKEGDHEVAMAVSSLESIAEAIVELRQKLGNVERNIPGWIQDHIAKAENYIEQAAQGFHELKHDE